MKKMKKLCAVGLAALCLAGSMSCFTMAEASEKCAGAGSGSDAVFIKNVGK